MISENNIVENVLSARYYAEGEHSWEDVCTRVSNFIGNTVEEQKEFKRLMMEKKFLPNSPTLFNAGFGGNLSACFVLPNFDDMMSIFETIKNSAAIYKMGGGCGFNYGNIRPKNSKVGSTNGVASGVISWMRVENEAIEAIKAGGRRRGAALACLPCNHGDIIDFLTCKKIEGRLKNFNLSVMMTDEFMQAVKNEEFDKIATYRIDDKGEHIPITVREIWNGLIDGSWANGEPAVLFDKNINDNNKLLKLGRIETTNPCFAPETLMLTREGYKSIIDLVGIPTEYWNGVEWSECIAKPMGKAALYNVEFSNGMSVIVTSNHRWFTTEGVVETKDLTTETKLIRTDYPVCEGTLEIDEPYKRGFFSGDGSECVDGRNRISVYPPKQMCFDVEIPKCGFASIECPKDWKKTDIPFGCKKEIIYEWIAGLIDSDGTRTNDGNIQISSVNKKFLKDVQLLLTTIGVYSSLSVMKKSEMKFMPDGHGNYKQYCCKESYRLNISCGFGNLPIPTKRVNMLKTIKHGYARFVKPISITYVRDDETYCMIEPKRHQIIANGMPTSNCGEQVLLPYESCNLGSINLSKYVIDGKIDFEELKRDSKIAINFLNNVIDKNVFPFEQLKEMSDKTRKIGYGLMGWHDMLIKLHIPYDSDEALDVLSKVLTCMRETAEDESHKLALKDGAFPAFEFSTWDKPMRNGALMTVAPTGSISLIAECSSGIEPVFNWVYERRNTVGKSFLMVHPLFDADLKKMTQDDEELYDKIVTEIYQKGSLQDVEELPQKVKDVYKCALDISPEWHVKTQACAQKYIDASISKTINLPNSATKEDVEKIYLMAYDMGCKGITVYRTGSRQDIVLGNADNEGGFTELIKNGRVFKKCPECGEIFESSAHCAVCPNCSYTRCSN